MKERWDHWTKTCGKPTVWCGLDWPEVVEYYVVLPTGDYEPALDVENSAVAVLQQMIKAFDAGALEMNSAEIGEPENDIPMHAWHEELIYCARRAVAHATAHSTNRSDP